MNDGNYALAAELSTSIGAIVLRSRGAVSDAGFDVHFVKPVDVETILEYLRS